MDIKNLLQRYEQVNEELNAALQENGQQFIESLFADIFSRHPGVNRLCILGYTPYFNDGDACTHSSEYFSGVIGEYSGRKYYDFDEYSTALEFMTEDLNESDEDNEENSLGLTPNTTEDNKVLKSAKSAMEAYEEIFNRVYDTNFIVKATRNEDGTVTVEDEYYNPEY